MNVLHQYMAEHGAALVAGATCLLALGWLGIVVQRSPVERQRTGEWTMLALLACLVLACVPMPRYSASLFQPVDSDAGTVLPPAESTGGLLAVVQTPEGPFLDSGQPLIEAPRVPEPVVRSGVSEPGMLPVWAEPPLPPNEGELQPLPVDGTVRTAEGQSRSAITTNDRPTAEGPASVDVRELLSAAYILGTSSCCAWLLLGRLFLLRMLWAGQTPESWLRDLYGQIPFPRPRRPRLLVSTRCTRPSSFGIWRPTILLPQSYCRQQGREVLRHVLRHELAHVAQRDAWGHLLFNLAFPVLYFHPLYWWIRRRSYLAAELVADDRAAEGTARESYVEALVKLARQRGGRQLGLLGSRQIFGSRSHFFRRMKMLLDRESRLALRCSRLWYVTYPAVCLLAIALVAGAVGVRPADAQQEAVADDDLAVTSESRAEAGLGETEEQPQVPDGADARGLADTAELDTGPTDPVEEPAPDSRGTSKSGAAAGALSEAEALLLRARALLQEHQAQTSQGSRLQQQQLADLQALLRAQVAIENRKAAELAKALIPADAPVARTPQYPAQTPTGPQRSFGASGSWVDLVSLAMAYADALGDLETAEVRYGHTKSLKGKGYVSEQQADIAKIDIVTARRKVDVLRGIAEAVLVAVEAERKVLGSRLTLLNETNSKVPGSVPRISIEALQAQLVIAESKLKSIKSILDTGGN